MRVNWIFFKKNCYVQDEWVVCKVHHKKGEASIKKPAEEYSSGTPNVSSVVSDDPGEGGDDQFLDSSMINPMYFNSAASLPSTTMTINAAPLHNADYSSISSTAAGATTTTRSSIVDLPNYGLNDVASYNLQQQVAVANSAASTNNSGSYSSLWNMLINADHNQAIGSYNLHHQAMVAKTLGGNYFAAGGLPSSSVTGILQHNSQGVPPQKLGNNYGDSSTAAIGPVATKSKFYGPSPLPAGSPRSAHRRARF